MHHHRPSNDFGLITFYDLVFEAESPVAYIVLASIYQKDCKELLSKKFTKIY